MSDKEIWLVSVTAGRWQHHGIQEAKAAGLKVIAIDADSHALGFTDADISLNMDLSDHNAIIEKLVSLNKNIKGAISFASEAGMELAAHIRDVFKLPGLSLTLCKRFIDKGVQRNIWSRNGVYGPQWKTCSNQREALIEAQNFEPPFIIKPTDSSGSRGVTKIESQSDDTQDAINHAFEFSKSGSIIIESFMVGTEFTVEVFVSNSEVHVLAVTEKKKIEDTKGTVAYELATPDRPFEVTSKIASTVIHAFKALDYQNGPGHAEVILMDDGSVGMVEVAARGGGFMVCDGLVPAASGVNLTRLIALQAVGQSISAFEILHKAVVLRFIPSRPGIIRKISGFEQANLINGVQAFSFVNIGKVLEKAKADGDRLGYILSCAESPSQAQNLANEAESLIHFSIEKINDH